MATVSIVHRPDRKAFAKLNPQTNRKIKTVIPFRIVQAPVKRSMQDGYVLARRGKVRLLARRRTNPVGTGADKQRGRRCGFSKQK